MSLGHIDLFHKAYGGLLFKSDSVAAPFCYRCPFNRLPMRADARLYRKCNWECTGQLERKFATRKNAEWPYAALVVEPLIQGRRGWFRSRKGGWDAPRKSRVQMARY